MPDSIASDPQLSGPAVLQVVASLLDAFDRPLVVADRSGRILHSNVQAQDRLRPSRPDEKARQNLFADMLQTDGKTVLNQLEAGKQEVILSLQGSDGASRARVRWLPEPDWLVVYLEPVLPEAPPEEAEMRQTVQELMQEREITYRNLLAAYLRLQEVNRQKTVFLASAAH